MKRKNIIIVTLFLLSGLFTIQSCKEEDPTTFVTKQAFTQPVATSPDVAADGTVFFTGSTVDLTWASTNSGGDPVTWDVYFGTGKAPALFQENLNVTTIAVPVLDGQTYYWRVEIVDSRGLKTTSKTFSFTAVNGTNEDMSASVSWTTDVKTSVGLDLTPAAAVNLRLLIIKKSDNSIYKIVNGTSAVETYSGFDTIPDGDYIIGVDISKTINAGQFTKPITIDLNLSFEQLGIISENFEFPQIMDNVSVCSYYRNYLAEVKKVGAEYTVTREVSKWIDPSVTDPAALVGTWSGDDFGYDSEISADFVGGKLMITGIGRIWMFEDWQEVIITESPVEATYNGDGTYSIANQAIMTTTYEGNPQPEYFIEGTIYANFCGGPDFLIVYDLIQPDGAGGLAQYFGVDAIEAAVSLDPVTKKRSSHITSKKIVPVR